jgi:hypothetical protein
VIFHLRQFLRPLTIAATVASGKPRTSGLMAAPSFTQIALAYMRSVLSV